MTKHTEKAGALPNGSIDFEKVQAAAKDGKDNIFEKAVSKEREEPKEGEGESEDKTADVTLADVAAEAEAEEAAPARRRR